ncbi:hypothetical protein GCM10010254_72360 [Streptomyces chromofuscus]|nr:hypothetical protein GCM10010254_72360 [Streptomyces chromofuscus]
MLPGEAPASRVIPTVTPPSPLGRTVAPYIYQRMSGPMIREPLAERRVPAHDYETLLNKSQLRVAVDPGPVIGQSFAQPPAGPVVVPAPTGHDDRLGPTRTAGPRVDG